MSLVVGCLKKILKKAILVLKGRDFRPFSITDFLK